MTYLPNLIAFLLEVTSCADEGQHWMRFTMNLARLLAQSPIVLVQLNWRDKALGLLMSCCVVYLSSRKKGIYSFNWSS